MPGLGFRSRSPTPIWTTPRSCSRSGIVAHLASGALLADQPDFRGRARAGSGRRPSKRSGARARTRRSAVTSSLPRSSSQTGSPGCSRRVRGPRVRGRPEEIRDLYARAATRWVEEGRHQARSLRPAPETEQIDAWFRLCFGASGVTAARETRPDSFESPVRGPRTADTRGCRGAAGLDRAMPTMRPAPIFSGQGADSRSLPSRSGGTPGTTSSSSTSSPSSTGARRAMLADDVWTGRTRPPDPGREHRPRAAPRRSPRRAEQASVAR